MAIRVSCSKCGTVLDVPEQAAGKSVPCPACQMKVFVPALGSGAPGSTPFTGGQAASGIPAMPAPRMPAPNPRPMEMPSPAPAAFQNYGVAPQGPPPLVPASAYPAAGQPGQWMQQPQYGQPQFGQPQFGQPPYGPAQYGPPAMPGHGPRRSRGFFGSPWVLTVITLLCLGGVALLVWWLFFSKGKADLAWLPDNPDVVVQIRVKDVLDSGFVRELEQAFPEVSRSNWQNLPEVPPGLDVAKLVESVDRLVIGGKVSAGEPLVVAYLNRDVDIKGLIEQAAAGGGGIGAGGVQEQQVAGKKMFIANDMAWCEVDDKVMVLGPSEEVRKVVERGPDPSIGGRLQDALDEADFDQTIAMAMAAPSGEDTDGIKAVYGSAQIDDSVELSFTLECDSSEMAAQIAEAASGAGTAIRQFAGGGLEDYEADRSGNSVTIEAEVNSSIIDELKSNIGNLLGPGFNPEQLFQF